jgi:hypothetical protein
MTELVPDRSRVPWHLGVSGIGVLLHSKSRMTWVGSSGTEVEAGKCAKFFFKGWAKRRKSRDTNRNPPEHGVTQITLHVRYRSAYRLNWNSVVRKWIAEIRGKRVITQKPPPPPFSLGLGRCSCYAGWGIWSFSSVMRGRHGVGTLKPATTAPPCIITFSSASDQSQNVMTQYRFGFSSYHYHKNTLWSRINKQVFRLLESCEIFAALCLEQMPLELHPTPHQTQCTAWVNRRHKVNVWMLSRWSALVAGSIPALKCEAKGTYWNFH